MRGDAGVGAANDDLFGGGEGTGVDVFHPTAAVADEVVVMAAKRIGQFVAGESLMKLQAAHDAQVTEELDGTVDRHAVDGAGGEFGVDFLDAERRLRV